MDLEDYIESGIIESYILGLATREEIVLFERMRNIYPQQINRELVTMEYKLEKIGREGSIAPPAQVWNRIAERIQWEEAPFIAAPPRNNNNSHTYILQPGSQTMTINLWWRCAFIAVCMLVMALAASTIYFYQKYHQLEQHFLQLYPVSQPVTPPAGK